MGTNKKSEDNFSVDIAIRKVNLCNCRGVCLGHAELRAKLKEVFRQTMTGILKEKREILKYNINQLQKWLNEAVPSKQYTNKDLKVRLSLDKKETYKKR